jgi:hypothetical protein
VVIDRFLPGYRVRESHAIEVGASAEHVYQAMMQTDFSRSRLIRILFAARGLPWREPLSVRDLPKLGFVLLGEEPGVEIVYGLVGRFWRPRGGIRSVLPAEFASFSESGYAKAAWNFRVDEESGSATTLSTETRVVTTDDSSRRAFMAYWRLIRPFSGLVRRRLLGLIRGRAEGQDSGGPEVTRGEQGDRSR